jgi:hypothetical protein
MLHGLMRHAAGPISAALVAVLAPRCEAQDGPLSLQAESLLTVSSYLGFAEYCTAYGTDYTTLAGTVRDGLAAHLAGDTELELVFAKGLAAGRQGALWSAQEHRFVDLLREGADMGQACALGHQQVVKISRLK